MGWTLVTRCRCRKMSSHKESTKQHIREKMVRRPKIITLSLYSKKKEIKMHHNQERPHQLHLENIFHMGSTQSSHIMAQKLYVVMSMKRKRKMQLYHINHQMILQSRLLKLKIHHAHHQKMLHIDLL